MNKKIENYASIIEEMIDKDKPFEEIKNIIIETYDKLTVQKILFRVLLSSPKGTDFYEYMGKNDCLSIYKKQMVEEARRIHNLVAEGLSFKEAADKAIDSRKISITDKEKVIIGTIILESEGEHFIGLGNNDETRISGTIIDGKTIVVSVSNKGELDTIYNGVLGNEGYNGFEANDYRQVMISVQIKFGIEDDDKQKIRQAFSCKHLKEV